MVATFSIIGDMTAEIAGDAIDQTTLVGPDRDAHVYQPTPSDARALAEADILIVNGPGFEGWLDQLIAASGFSGVTAVATTGVIPLGPYDTHSEDGDEHDDHGDHGHAHGAFDPHAWQSIANAGIYAANITDGLAATDPANREKYIAGGDACLARITKTETEVTALIRQIHDEQIPAVFIESISDRRRDRWRPLFRCAFWPHGPAPTYLEMMRYNSRELAAALAS